MPDMITSLEQIHPERTTVFIPDQEGDLRCAVWMAHYLLAYGPTALWLAHEWQRGYDWPEWPDA